MEAKIAVETRFDESMIVQEIHGASNGESLVKSVIRLKEDGACKALAELGYMEPAEAKALRARVAELEARAVVVPDDTFTLDLDEFGKSLVCITINSKNRGVGYELCGTMGDGHFSRRTFDITPYLGHCLNTIGVRAIPADRVLGDGMVAVDREELEALRRFAERCAQRDHQPDEHIGSAKCVACEAEDALRANQGGAAT